MRQSKSEPRNRHVLVFDEQSASPRFTIRTVPQQRLGSDVSETDSEVASLTEGEQHCNAPTHYYYLPSTFEPGEVSVDGPDQIYVSTVSMESTAQSLLLVCNRFVQYYRTEVFVETLL